MFGGNISEIITNCGVPEIETNTLQKINKQKSKTLLTSKKVLEELNASKKSKREEAEEDFKNGDIFFTHGSKENSIKYFEKSIKKDPTFHKPYLSLMLYYEGIGDFHRALEQCKILLSLDKYNYLDSELEVLNNEFEYYKNRIKNANLTDKK